MLKNCRAVKIMILILRDSDSKFKLIPAHILKTGVSVYKNKINMQAGDKLKEDPEVISRET